MADVIVPVSSERGVASAVLEGMTRYMPNNDSVTGFIGSPARNFPDNPHTWGGVASIAFSYAIWGSAYGLPSFASTETFYAQIKPVVGQTWVGRVKTPGPFGFFGTGSAAWSEPSTSSTGEWGYTRLDKSAMNTTELASAFVSIAPIPDFSFGETLPLISGMYAYDESIEVLTIRVPETYRSSLTGTQITTATLTGTKSTTATLTGTKSTTATLTGSAGE